jgi:hypothetical protein
MGRRVRLFAVNAGRKDLFFRGVGLTRASSSSSSSWKLFVPANLPGILSQVKRAKLFRPESDVRRT